ncbi:MAG: ATP-binding cassette domain-containing protein [Eubacteriales bacterium]|nr:ATP-binding cassette domain-containing protein [Eubacteriales bacterium]
MQENIITVEHVYKTFKNTTVLNDVSISFARGKIHGIIGRNGSGKTVLFKCICGFMPITSGTISVRGKRVGKDVDIPENLGVIIESPGFLPNYSAYANLKFLAELRHIIEKEKIRETIRFVGLNPDDKKHVSKYSMGMRQRLGLAQAIMEDPDILILDEPMNGLDKHGVQEIRECLIQLRNAGKTILLASHNAEDIRVLCDTVCEMDGGVLTVLPTDPSR